MTLSLIVFIASFLFLLAFNRKIKGVVLDGFFYVMAPYVVIITINNVIMTNHTFYAVKDYVIDAHTVALYVFFIGSLFGFAFSKQWKFVIGKIHRPERIINLKKIKIVAVVTHLVVLVDICMRYIRNGLESLVSDSKEFNAGFLAGHALILLVPLAIILLYNAIDHTDKVALIQGVISMALIFTSFVKYHIIGAMLAVFIYLAIKKPKIIIKMGIVITGLIVAVFVGNYIISFAVRNSTAIDQNFYLYHLWKYIGGSSINFDAVNRMYPYPSKQGLSIALWILQNVMSFPNMFIAKIIGHNIPDYMMQVPYIAVGTTYETSNVISMIASIYIQSNIVEYIVILFFWGAIVEYARERCFNTTNECKRIILCIFIAFNLLSFFGSFFVKSATWEMMIDTMLLFLVFHTRGQINEKNSIQYL